MFCFQKADFESQEEYKCENEGDLELESHVVRVFVVSFIMRLMVGFQNVQQNVL